jgi:hypothetical protein
MEKEYAGDIAMEKMRTRLGLGWPPSLGESVWCLELESGGMCGGRAFLPSFRRTSTGPPTRRHQLDLNRILPLLETGFGA